MSHMGSSKQREAASGKYRAEEFPQENAFTAAPAGWPEVEMQEKWKRNPNALIEPCILCAGLALCTLLLLMVVSAGRVSMEHIVLFINGDVIPVELIVWLLIACAGVSAIYGMLRFGVNDRSSRSLRRVAEAETTVRNCGDVCVLQAYRPKPWNTYQRISLPDEVSGMKIIATADGLFKRNRYLAYVELPSSLEAVSPSMFEKCDNLPAIMLPLSVKSIGAKAFAGCAELRDIYITAAVTQIAPNAFHGCKSLNMHVQRGSYAEQYAKEHGIGYSYS